MDTTRDLSLLDLPASAWWFDGLVISVDADAFIRFMHPPPDVNRDKKFGTLREQLRSYHTDSQLSGFLSTKNKTCRDG